MYRPPAAAAAPPSFSVPGARLKWIYAGVTAVGVGASMIADELQDPTVARWTAGTGLAVYVGSWVIGLCWLHVAWSSIPREIAAPTRLGEISADSAIARFVIPLYNVYWSFVVHSVLAKALTAGFKRYRVAMSGEPQLAYAATLLTLVPKNQTPSPIPSTWVFALRAIIACAWLAYMHRCDTLRRILLLAWRAEEEGRG
jgi:hypothetical protein